MSIRHTNKKEFSLNHSSQDVNVNLNKSLVGCVPCLNSASKIENKVAGRSLNEIKIDEIKEIVSSIFESSKNGI